MGRWAKNIVGLTFGRWLVISESDTKMRCGAYFWLCECQCEKKTRRVIAANQLEKGIRTNCGCLGNLTRGKKTRAPISIEEKYGDWTVIGLGVREPAPLKGGAWWLCRCVCGTERPVPSDRLRRGRSKGCGCRRMIHQVETTRRKKEQQVA